MLVDKNISIYNIETLNVHLRRQLAFVAFFISDTSAVAVALKLNWLTPCR